MKSKVKLENTDSTHSRGSRCSLNSKSVWSKKEHTLMLEFLAQNKSRIERHISSAVANKSRSAKSKFFQSMAAHIKSKTVSQCKSRYQKKELEVLALLGLPPALLQTYAATKKGKKVPAEVVEPVKSVTPFESVDNARPPPSQPEPTVESTIETPEALRELLVEDILPRILTAPVKDDMLSFVEFLVSGDGRQELLCGVGVNSVHKNLSKHGIFQLRRLPTKF